MGSRFTVLTLGSVIAYHGLLLVGSSHRRANVRHYKVLGTRANRHVARDDVAFRGVERVNFCPKGEGGLRRVILIHDVAAMRLGPLECLHVGERSGDYPFVQYKRFGEQVDRVVGARVIGAIPISALKFLLSGPCNGVLLTIRYAFRLVTNVIAIYVRHYVNTACSIQVPMELGNVEH